MFCRLIPPTWLKDQGARVEEGIFKTDYIDQKNKEGFGAYWFPNHPHPEGHFSYKHKKYLSGKWTKEDFIKEVVNFGLRPHKVSFEGVYNLLDPYL